MKYDLDISGKGIEMNNTDKVIIQFHDGQMIRQRVCADIGSAHIIMKDLRNANIDMSTVIITNRHANNYPIGYLHFEYPLVGDKVTGVFGG